MIRNLTRNTTIATNIEIAEDPYNRMKGLLGRSEFSQGEALIITQCQSIHMFFMKFSIDVIFCNNENKVVGLCENIKPFNLSPLFLKASYAIELPSGTINSSQTKLGDQVQL